MEDERESEDVVEESQDDQALNVTPAPVTEIEENEMVVPDNVQLMSPSNQLDAPILGHQNPLMPYQAQHFVAFESDEEDNQQYDLLPISLNPSGASRNMSQSGPHGSSQSGVQQPVGVPSLTAVSHHHLNHHSNNVVVRNRYFESGSGDEEVVDIVANASPRPEDIEDEQNQMMLDQVNV